MRDWLPGLLFGAVVGCVGATLLGAAILGVMSMLYSVDVLGGITGLALLSLGGAVVGAIHWWLE